MKLSSRIRKIELAVLADEVVEMLEAVEVAAVDVGGVVVAEEVQNAVDHNHDPEATTDKIGLVHGLGLPEIDLNHVDVLNHADVLNHVGVLNHGIDQNRNRGVFLIQEPDLPHVLDLI